MRRVLWMAMGLVSVLALSGCDSIQGWFYSDTKVNIPGERISVLAFDSQLDPDPQLADVPVELPKPWSNADRSEEHTSELQSLMRISYAVFCLKKKKQHEYITILNNPNKFKY